MAKAIGPRRVNGLLGSTALADLVRRARSTPMPDKPSQGNKQAPTDFLPPALRDRVHLILEDDQLLMLAENNAVAQLLRFQGPALARRFSVRQWRVRVSPLPAPGQSMPREKGASGEPAVAPMPTEAARALRQAAAGIDDEALGDALRRLANNADRQ